jgi:hypothetical protein
MLVYPQSSFVLNSGEVNRTVSGQDHVLERRVSGCKDGGGISRVIGRVKGREASRR